MMVSRKLENNMKEIQFVYLVKNSSRGEPEYNIGNYHKIYKMGFLVYCVQELFD